MVGGEDFWARLAFHGFDMVEVAVVVVEDKHVGVARAGGLDEASCKIGEELAGDGGAVRKEFVRALRVEGGGSVVVGRRVSDGAGGSWRRKGRSR